MRFYLGTHRPSWLERTAVPLFISRLTLPKRALPRARGPWALDSGGFSELSLRGGWSITPRDYARDVRRYASEIGGLEWAAIQDYMCEPFIVSRTGLTVAEHQRRTVASYIELYQLAPEIAWLPVVQGYAPDDYLRCVELYDRAGVDLSQAPRVGVGSVCRRQGTAEIASLLARLAALGLKLHGFGVKREGLARAGACLHSSDSMAWSFRARKIGKPLPGCIGHKNCANCLTFALHWRAKLLDRLVAA